MITVCEMINSLRGHYLGCEMKTTEEMSFQSFAENVCVRVSACMRDVPMCACGEQSLPHIFLLHLPNCTFRPQHWPFWSWRESAFCQTYQCICVFCGESWCF